MDAQLFHVGWDSRLPRTDNEPSETNVGRGRLCCVSLTRRDELFGDRGSKRAAPSNYESSEIGNAADVTAACWSIPCCNT